MNDNIFQPNYTITPITQGTIADIVQHRWLVDNMLLMPKHEVWIRRDVSIQRAVGTTRIEGATLEEDDVQHLFRKGQTGKLTEDEQANINALRAYEFVDFLSDQRDVRIDELVIRQLNREFLTKAPDPLTPGVYRRGQNSVGAYDPPNEGDVPSLMRSFALWLRQEDDTDPIIKACIAHIHLVAIHSGTGTVVQREL